MKKLATNLVATFLVVISFFVSEELSGHIFYIGSFALSGSLTNQIAIHMLFNKVPFFYGSGIIELKFEELKLSIKKLILNEFFTKDRIEEFLKDEEKKISLTPLIEKFDFNGAFEALKSAIIESKFAPMLSFIGGESALDNLKEPFTQKLKSSIIKVTSSKEFNQQIQNYLQSSSFSDNLVQKIDSLVQKRLNELSPKMVKQLLQDLMQEYLGWLVVWGGVFGGILGFVGSYIR
jgi:uncharacterized membrane protein YheB (UPF0754 family)